MLLYLWTSWNIYLKVNLIHNSRPIIPIKFYSIKLNYFNERA
jgi:hypothetical protein